MDIGSYNVDINEAGDGVVINFQDVDNDGGHAFTTCLPPQIAICLAAAILNMALECGDDVL